MKRFSKFFALVLVLASSSAAWAVQFPYIGMCQGNGVRLREDPGDGEIIGKLNRGDVFVVIDETFVDGQRWFEIDHPTAKGTAFISGRYVAPEYAGDENVDTAGCRMSAAIQMAFGITPEKAHAIHGREKEIADGPGEEVLIYDNFRLYYSSEDDESDMRLHRVEVNNGTMPFGEIQIGDTQEKLLEVLGNEISDPDENLEGWTCSTALGEEIFFGFGVGKNDETVITFMSWGAPVG